VVRIIEHLGLPVGDIDLEEIDQECVNRVKGIRLPALIIHGERDSLVPKKEAESCTETLVPKIKNCSLSVGRP